MMDETPRARFSNIMGVPDGTPTHSECGPDEWKVRVELALAYRLLEQYRMSDLIHTHISVRVSGTHDQFLQLPYGHLFSEAKASNMVKCDIDGTVISDPTGLGISVGGFCIHSAIHQARADANVIVHVHTRATVAVSCLKDGLLPLSQHAMRFYRRIAYMPYRGAFDDPAKRREIPETLGNAQVLMLRNHGPLVVGRTVAEAIWRIIFLERACDMQIAIQSAGTKVVWPDEEHVLFMAEAFDDPDLRGCERVWQALERMMYGKDSSFAD